MCCKLASSSFVLAKNSFLFGAYVPKKTDCMKNKLFTVHCSVTNSHLKIIRALAFKAVAGYRLDIPVGYKCGLPKGAVCVADDEGAQNKRRAHNC